MDMEKLAHLKELAHKATPGPWDTGASRHDPSWVVWRETGFQIAACQICVNGFNNAAYIAAISPDVLLALIKEIEQLRHEKDFYTRAMADYLQVAKMAWGGEIPSPLPGHNSSEEKMIEQFEYLNCPCCGGSGHVGDCDKAIQNLKCDLGKAQSTAERLEKEADWLAIQLSRCRADSSLGLPFCPLELDRQPGYCDYDDSDEGRVDDCACDGEMPCSHKIGECWRETARKAVAENTK